MTIAFNLEERLHFNNLRLDMTCDHWLDRYQIYRTHNSLPLPASPLKARVWNQVGSKGGWVSGETADGFSGRGNFPNFTYHQINAKTCCWLVNFLLQILVSVLSLDKGVVVIVVFRESLALPGRTRFLTSGAFYTDRGVEMVF